VKKIDLERNDTDIQFFHKEVTFWILAKHSHIVSYYGSFLEGPVLHIVMELMLGGSLADLLRTAFPRGLPNEALIASILKGVVEALAYLAKHNQVHRDIKPGNILISSEGAIKIADFGVAADMSTGGKRTSRYTVIGTPCYMAPEIYEETPLGYTEKADIWSLGITAIELGIGYAPNADLPPLAVIEKILNGPAPELPRERVFSNHFRTFVDSCLGHDPERRPSAEDLLKSPFLQRAKPDDFVRDALLKHLLSPQQRLKHIKESGIQKSLIDRFKLPPSKSAPEWTFEEEAKPPEPKGEPPKEKGSRFKITRQKADPPLERAVTSPDSMLSGVTSQEEIPLELVVTALDLRVKNLEAENKRLLRLVGDLVKRVEQLEGGTK
jgi:serine/threonine-protein kinase OSR1/STK39